MDRATNQNKSKATEAGFRVRGCGKGTVRTASAHLRQVEMLLEEIHTALTGCSTSSGSGGVPVRNELQNFEMLIRQWSLASEPFPWGSCSHGEAETVSPKNVFISKPTQTWKPQASQRPIKGAVEEVGRCHGREPGKFLTKLISVIVQNYHTIKPPPPDIFC